MARRLAAPGKNSAGQFGSKEGPYDPHKEDDERKQKKHLGDFIDKKLDGRPQVSPCAKWEYMISYDFGKPG